MIYDIAIIGGGSAGLSVAAAAAQLGQSVVLFEKGEMGGECLNAGCVPSKALLSAAKAAQAHRTCGPIGIAATEPVVDFAKVMDHVARAIATIAPHDSQARFESLGVKVVRAVARFTAPDRLLAGGEEFAARRIVIATGSRVSLPAIPGLADVPFFTNETIFRNRVQPTHLVVIGGGPIGLEMAQAFRRLGSAVTVLEAAAALGREDPELAAVVLRQIAAEGIVIHAQAKIQSVAASGDGIAVRIEGRDIITGSHLLVAAGRRPNLEGLDLEKGNIRSDSRGGVMLDHGLRSVSNRKVYAIGDAAGGLQFTHVAGYQAGLVIRHALFRLPIRNRTDIIPRATFTEPELAHVGLTEAEARAAHGAGVKVLRSDFAGNDRAVAEAETAGFVKIMTSARGRILGASIVGPHAGELIAPWALAVTRSLKISAMAGVVLPYPTLGEAGKRAAITYYQGLATKPWLRKLIGILKIFG